MNTLGALRGRQDALADVAARSGSLLLYLYGSCAAGRERPDSDVDVAVLLDDRRAWSAVEREASLDQIGLEVARLLGRPRDDVDVEDVDGMPPAGVFEVIRTGRCVYEGEPHLRVCFERQVMSTYQDFEPIERYFREVTHRGLLVVNRSLMDAHLADLDRHVAMLERERGKSAAGFAADPIRALGVQHGLQICIETVANMANHLSAECGFGAARSYVETFQNLQRGGVVRDAELASRLVQMARFRNLVVHRYWDVDMDRVLDILENHLEDFRAVARDIVRYMAEHPEV